MLWNIAEFWTDNFDIRPFYSILVQSFGRIRPQPPESGLIKVKEFEEVSDGLGWQVRRYVWKKYSNPDPRKEIFHMFTYLLVYFVKNSQ
jgi:hypothetical protein